MYGLDLTGIGPEVSDVDGMRVLVRLPAPGLLARTFLAGRNAYGVPSYAAASEAPDPVEALTAKVEWLFTDLENALAKDIEGASIEVVVAASIPRDTTTKP